VHDDAGAGDGPGRRPVRATGLRCLHSATRRLHPPPHKCGPQDQACPCGQASAGAGAARPSPSPPRLRAAVELRGRPWRRASSSVAGHGGVCEVHLSHCVVRGSERKKKGRRKMTSGAHKG
jgi:hypothetical protein